ncbi:cellulase family glycosylhydrolase [Paenibacillus kobensis]|uniref:cellulase family glycosylhydrolase n=1 Tax=Paenibacillus kobensis TaxID=59841 RepID=UPI000FD9FA3D|nr:cellulase family glycosylhydrolase [Paenibacillus kobensis]
MYIAANRKGLLMLLVLTLVLSLLLPAGHNKSYAAGPIVPTYGQIKVSGNQLVSASGQPIQLKGASSHGVQYYGNYVNKNVIQWLRDDWGATVYRVALYTEEKGYITNPALKDKVKEAVQAAIDLGIYVIIDWHILSDGDPNKHKTEAIAFFKEMATLYGSYPNVLYEIANEPNGVSWSTIKTYAQDVIPAIRAIDPDNIIIVGTPTWSQDVDQAADSPLAFSNIMYTMHFYAGTHGQYLRDKVNYALNKGIAVFSTEWGTSTATGDGGPYPTESTQWLDFLNSKKISWVNWSIATKAESSAALLPSASTSGGWALSDLTSSGQYVRSKMLEGSVTQPTVPAAPANLSATAGNGQATLTWTGSTGATSYNVKRSTSNGGPYTTVATGVSVTSYTNTALTNGTTYYYVVSAVNSAGESANSSQASATPQASVTVPAAPAGLSATAGNAQVALSWTASSGATGYNVKRSTTAGGTYTTVATGVIGTSYTNTALTNGTTYYYVVSAVNSAGESANSSQASATPAGTTTPPDPTGALAVQYKVNNANATDNMIYATFNIKNTGTTAVSLSGLKLRYYLTKDSANGMSFWTDYAQIGTSNVSGAFSAISPAKTNADTYLELSFSSAAGSIPAGGQSGDIQIRIAKSDWSNLNENNDYSYDGTKSAYASWNKVTLYQSGTLVWGIEP